MTALRMVRLAVAAATALGWFGMVPAGAQAPRPQAPPAAAQPSPPPANPSNDVFGEEVTLPGTPIVYIAGSGLWESAFKTIVGALNTLNTASDKQGIKSSGPPMTIYTATDDSGFQFQTALPVTEVPTLPAGSELKTGKAPAGKALKFVHRGSYDAMDTTYDAITNYLDEKQLDAKDLFIEQFAKDPATTPEDDLVVEIFVPLK
jgi:effector-binding domain-containing protein